MARGFRSLFHDFSYGPEATRILLVRNTFGYDEPVMVFNSRHRKIKGFKNEENIDDNDEEVIVNLHLYHSMFLCYPFQFEYGVPANINGNVNPKFTHTLFSKVITLERTNIDKRDVEKNWSPFINVRERINGADTHIYFIYRWANIEVYKCELNFFSQGRVSKCETYYRKDITADANSAVGSLRGGTELIHLNQYLPHLKNDAWFGVARAHLMGCDCGDNIPVEGFFDPKIKCDQCHPSALIPNGLSSWEVSHHNDEYSLKTSD